MQRASAPSYDRFKLIITVILAIIILLMLLRGCAINATPASPAEQIASPITTEEPVLPPDSTVTDSPSHATETFTSSPIEPTVSATLIEPTATSASSDATPTASVEPASVEPTATVVATETPASAETTPTSSPDSAGAEPTATVVAAETPASGETASCNTSSPSRLAVGQGARVLQRLNLRSDASINATIINTNPTGTQVEVIGGPICTPVGERAYLWWQIRLPDGTEGWSAETPLNQSGYFLEPIS